MPQYLRTASVRLLEASQEALTLALFGLGIPSRHELRSAAAQFAAPAGLIGAAAEQAMSAILVQVQGEEALMAAPNQFKSAREVLKDVRDLLRTPVPRVSFLTVGMADADAHRESLLKATEGFALIIGERAAGLHAGHGPSRLVTLVQAQKVLAFYGLLSKSSRIRPYLEYLPRPPEDTPNSDVIVEDLARRFHESKSLGDRSEALRSLFLVLPEVPELEPEWLGAFDRSAVAPTNDDINLLLQTLEQAEPVRFHRMNASGKGLAVSVHQHDPNALPIAQHHLRRAFGDLLGQFEAYVGAANGRLDEGHLDVPPESVLLDMFVLGPPRIAQVLNRNQLSAHEAWPFIVTALSSQGTTRPFWFLVSMVDDKGQLIAQLRRAFAATSRAHLRQQEAPTLEALEALRNGRPLEPTAHLAEFARDAFEAAERKKMALAAAIERCHGTNRVTGPDAEATLRRVSEGELVAGQAFDAVMALVDVDALRYWTRLIAESSTDLEDRDMLVQIHRNANLVPAQSAARKAMKLIDTITYGPQIELE